MTVQPERINTLKSRNNQDIFNAIYPFMPNEFKSIVPEMEAGTMGSYKIGQLICGNKFLENTFYTNLANRIAFVFGTSRAYYNKFASLRKGQLEFGDTAEEVFVEACKPRHYNPELSESRVFKRAKSNILNALHVVNAHYQYPTTIEEKALHRYFLSSTGLFNLVQDIIMSAVNGAEIDAQNMIKYLLGRAILDNHIKTVIVPNTGDKTKDSNEIAIIMKENTDNMTFPRTDYNASGVINWTSYEFIKFMLSTNFGARYSIDVLSASFQLEYTNFMGELMKFDDLSNVDFVRLNECLDVKQTEYSEDEKLALKGVVGLSFDEYLVQWYNNVFEWGDIKNPDGMYWNQFLNVWDMVSISPFAPACAYVTATGSVTGVTVSPTSLSVGVVGTMIPLNVKVAGTGIYNKAVTYEVPSTLEEFINISPDGILSVVKLPTDANKTANITIKTVGLDSSSAQKTCTLALTVTKAG